MIAANVPLSLFALREESAGIYKAIKTRVPQYRVMLREELTIDEPENANHVMYDTEITPAGQTICVVAFRVRNVNENGTWNGTYWNSGYFRAWIE